MTVAAEGNRLWFGRNAPFYPFVMAFWAAVHGINELISRRIVEQGSSFDPAGIFDVLSSLPGNPERFVDAKVTPLLLVAPKMQSLTGPDIEGDVSELAAELMAELPYLTSYMLDAPLRSLLAGCYAATEDNERDPHDPAWEFFRHCRNAAAHGGVFRFVRDEPRRAAVWRGIEITKALQGTPLVIPLDGDEPLIRPGDVLRLLSDLEQTFNTRLADGEADG